MLLIVLFALEPVRRSAYDLFMAVHLLAFPVRIRSRRKRMREEEDKKEEEIEIIQKRPGRGRGRKGGAGDNKGGAGAGPCSAACYRHCSTSHPSFGSVRLRLPAKASSPHLSPCCSLAVSRMYQWMINVKVQEVKVRARRR